MCVSVCAAHEIVPIVLPWTQTLIININHIFKIISHQAICSCSMSFGLFSNCPSVPAANALPYELVKCW